MARVLLVLDDLAEAARLRRVLRAAGYATEMATSAADARLAAPGCDLMVVDAACDGGEALAWARRPGAPPGVALGSDPADAEPLRALATPANAAALIAALGDVPARVAAADPTSFGTDFSRPSGQPTEPEPGLAPPVHAPTRSEPDRVPANGGFGPTLARTAEAALRALFGSRAPRAASGPPPIDLAALVEAARTRDYFEVLSVSRSCSSAEARDAADALLAAVEHQDEGTSEGHAARLGDLRQVLLDARSVLGEDALREAYRTALGEPARDVAGAVAAPRTE